MSEPTQPTFHKLEAEDLARFLRQGTDEVLKGIVVRRLRGAGKLHDERMHNKTYHDHTRFPDYGGRTVEQAEFSDEELEALATAVEENGTTLDMQLDPTIDPRPGYDVTIKIPDLSRSTNLEATPSPTL